MPEAKAYSYAVVRAVPRVEREEYVNVGVIVYSQQWRFLAAKVHINRERLLALWPQADLETLERHTAAIPRICAGDPTAGPIARCPLKDRFHWLTAPRSTIIQVSPIRNGLTQDPEVTLQRLAHDLVV